MRKSQMAILVFTLLFIGITLYYSGVFSNKRARIKRVKRSQSSVQESAQFVTLDRDPYAEGWGRDPFFLPGEKTREPASVPLPRPKSKPPSPVVVAAPPLKLEMILHMNGVKGAILNGRFFKTGDPVGSEVLVKIGSDGVILEKNGKKRIVKLDPFLNPFRVEERKP